MSAVKLMGYKRADGRYGVRNYVLVISTVHCANAVVNKIAQKAGVIGITHDKGCVESVASQKTTFLGLSRAGQHPNVYGVLLVSLGCEQTNAKAMKEEIAKVNPRVELLTIQEEGGSPETIEKGVKIVSAMKAEAEAQQREEMPMSQLVVGVQCGGSDWTTALAGNVAIGKMSDNIVAAGGSVLMGEVDGFPGSEHIIAEHAVSHEVGASILNMTNDLREKYLEKTGHSIEEVNPTPGNKAGGITTLVEKSMGNVKKMGSSPVQGIVKQGESIPHPGVWILDNRSEGPDSFNITAFSMSGAHTVAFSSGRGTPVGNATMPVVKITGNPVRYEKLKSIFDFNAGTLLEGDDLEKVGKELFETIIRKVNGEESKSEINEDWEYTIPYEIG
jgi:altronate dehydratase